jgi:hypothetical protein
MKKISEATKKKIAVLIFVILAVNTYLLMGGHRRMKAPINEGAQNARIFEEAEKRKLNNKVATNDVPKATAPSPLPEMSQQSVQTVEVKKELMIEPSETLEVHAPTEATVTIVTPEKVPTKNLSGVYAYIRFPNRLLRIELRAQEALEALKNLGSNLKNDENIVVSADEVAVRTGSTPDVCLFKESEKEYRIIVVTSTAVPETCLTLGPVRSSYDFNQASQPTKILFTTAMTE